MGFRKPTESFIRVPSKLWSVGNIYLQLILVLCITNYQTYSKGFRNIHKSSLVSMKTQVYAVVIRSIQDITRTHLKPEHTKTEPDHNPEHTITKDELS